MSNLSEKKCKPCEGGIPPLTGQELTPWLKQIDQAWKLTEGETKIRREFTFKDFVQTMAFANKVAEVAEKEGHHPDLHISYGKLTIELWTHKISGLFDNDFILAAKIDELYSASS
ncbi:MAG: 4a-hydroxytetrahydrobiopterin dehydratase [Candidatus Andersenbacteria bacterium]|nr:4a-hydroxytetrahydrobiopterin dehydratase [Candidatus Andersenbacteria bacterium]MBI3250694.1 4a-hydroxytetrahydrobiopterin dehydratase [Candidatus Andersenbacteria bacterium]